MSDESAKRAPTVKAVQLRLEGHEPADLLAALKAAHHVADDEADSWLAQGEHDRARVARGRAQRLEQLLAKCGREFAAQWAPRGSN